MNCKVCGKELRKEQKSTCNYQCRSIYVSSLNKGRPSPYKGKTDRWDEETRKKIGDAQRGKPKSEAFKEKCRQRMAGIAFFKGHKHTEEWGREQSVRIGGEKHYNYKNRGASGEGKSHYGLMIRREKYGFTQELFDKTLEEQGNKCVICGEEFDETKGSKKKAADHCHATNTPRGILCRQCNLLLGLAKEKVEILEQAIKYLDTWKRTA